MRNRNSYKTGSNIPAPQAGFGGARKAPFFSAIHGTASVIPDKAVSKYRGFQVTKFRGEDLHLRHYRLLSALSLSKGSPITCSSFWILNSKRNPSFPPTPADIEALPPDAPGSGIPLPPGPLWYAPHAGSCDSREQSVPGSLPLPP